LVITSPMDIYNLLARKLALKRTWHENVSVIEEKYSGVERKLGELLRDIVAPYPSILPIAGVSLVGTASLIAKIARVYVQKGSLNSLKN